MNTPNIEHAKWIFERTLGWIEAAELKLGIVISIQIATLGGLAAAYASAGTKTPAEFGCALAAAIISVCVVFFAAVALWPRTTGPVVSLLYFGRIKELSLSEYGSKLKTMSEADFVDDIARQIHRNSEIAVIKFRWLSRAIEWSFISGAAWAIAIALLVRR